MQRRTVRRKKTKGRSSSPRRRVTGLLLGVDADVIDEHLLRENGGAVGRAGPIAAHGDVEDDEEGVIENPGAAGGPLRRVKCSVKSRIDIEADCVGLPFDRVEMKVVGEILAGGQAEGRGDVARSADGARAMQRSVNGAWLLADIFHDVDFAALLPAI